MMAYGYTHLGRAVVPDPKLGGAEYEDVKFESSDGLELEGWYIPSKNGAAVIAFPGRSGPRQAARFLARHGYGVLLFDRRGEGDSEGDPNSLGWGGTKDLEGAVAFLRTRPDVDPERIGGIGRSVGGELLLQFAEETDDLKAVVSEGAGDPLGPRGRRVVGGREVGRPSDVGRHHCGHGRLLGPQPAAATSRTWPAASSRRRCSSSTPIRAREARTSPPTTTRSRAEPKQLWKTDSKHVGGYDAAPVQYERRVVSFFNQSLR